MRCAEDDAEWYCVRYKNCGRLEEYLGDTQPYFVEVLAVRFAQWLNGGYSLDWSHENWITALVREVGPGFRLGFFATSLYVVFFSSFILDSPLLFAYDIHNPQADMRFGNATLIVTFYLWVLDFGIVALCQYLIRHHGALSRPGEDGHCTPFFRVPIRRLREERREQPETAYVHTVRALFAVFFTLYFVVAVFAMHTILSHMYIKENVYFAALLVLKVVMVLASSVDDLTHIGSPWGIQEASKTASVLLSLRGLILVPQTVLWSAAAVAASWPPSYCKEC